MPNITGKMIGGGTFTEGNTDGSGALFPSGAYTGNNRYTADTTSKLFIRDININASRSSAIYGNSDTVMVDSYNIPVAIYLG